MSTQQTTIEPPNKNTEQGMSLVTQWLGRHASTAGGTGSIPRQATEILRSMRPINKF